MKEFLKALKYVLICQLICWGVFILFDENQYMSTNVAMIVGIILLAVLLVLYFVFINKIIEKNKLKSMKFNMFLSILWIGISVITTLILLNLTGEYLQKCDPDLFMDCFMNGFEYLIQGYCMVQLAILILVIKLIINLIKQKNKK